MRAWPIRVALREENWNFGGFELVPQGGPRYTYSAGVRGVGRLRLTSACCGRPLSPLYGLYHTICGKCRQEYTHISQASLKAEVPDTAALQRMVHESLEATRSHNPLEVVLMASLLTERVQALHAEVQGLVGGLDPRPDVRFTRSPLHAALKTVEARFSATLVVE